MKYTGQFRSIFKNKLYEVQIVTGGASTPETEITIGPGAFTTTMSGDSNVLYVPVKYSSASVELVSNGYTFNLYANSAKDNTVKLIDKSNNAVVWTGYAQPNAYDVPFDFETETYTLECLDGLAVLQYYDYEAGGVISTDADGIKEYSKRFVTFRDIINTVLGVAACYTNWYFSTNTSIQGGTGVSILDATISEENFFDEDDKPMKCAEVLEHICKFCGVSCVADGTNVYFVDYDAIKHSVNTYYKYSVGGTTATTQTISSAKTIASTDYASTGSTLTLDNTYSKVTVRDSLYTVDQLLPDMFEEDDLTNITSSGHYYNSMSSTSGSYIFKDKNGWEEFWGASDEYKYFYGAHKLYKNNHNWISHLFNNSKQTATWPTSMTGLTCKNYIGCLPGRFYVVADKDSVQDAKKGTIDYEDYLFFFQNGNTADDLCLFENNVAKTPKFFLPQGTKFVFSGDLLFTLGTYTNLRQADSLTKSFPYLPITDDVGSALNRSAGDGGTQTHDHLLGCTKNQIYYKDNRFGQWGWTKYTYTGSEMDFLNFSLSLGNQYLQSVNGTASTWGSTEQIISIPVTVAEDDCAKSIVSNVTVDTGIDGEGYVINTPYIQSNGCLAATPHFKFYGFNIFGYRAITAAWLKDFKLKCEYPLQLSGDERITDTEYEYNIDDSFTNELPAIEFKICTWDNKSVNFSAVAYPNGDSYIFIDKLNNAALAQNLRAEEQLCYKIVHQYQTASKKLNLNLFENANNVTITPWTLITEPVINTQMIIDSMSHNYIYDSVNLSLIEKK